MPRRSRSDGPNRRIRKQDLHVLVLPITGSNASRRWDIQPLMHQVRWCRNCNPGVHAIEVDASTNPRRPTDPAM
jgi:hypothetical protein